MGRVRYFTESCFVCGRSNPKGLQAQFISDGDVVTTQVTPRVEFQGITGVVHGGVVAALLDETLWYAVYAAGYTTLTVRLNLTLRRSATAGEPLFARGRYVGRDRRFLLGEGVLCDCHGTVLAEAEGQFLVSKKITAHLGDVIIAEKFD